MQANELDQRQREELGRRLDEREQELEAAIAGLRAALATPATPEVRDSVEDGDTRAAASVNLVHLQRQEDALLELRHARDRMQQGGYGLCEECEEPIPLARLQARPEARFCLEHEAAWEKAHPVTPVQP